MGFTRLYRFRKKQASTELDAESELHSARPVENIFDSEVQCHFVFATETLIQKTGPFSADLSSYLVQIFFTIDMKVGSFIFAK